MIHHPEQPLDPPYREDDDRPQFGTLTRDEQLEIICEFAESHYHDYINYLNEAQSQLPEGSDKYDLWSYIARCIVHNHGEPEEWTI